MNAGLTGIRHETFLTPILNLDPEMDPDPDLDLAWTRARTSMFDVTYGEYCT